MTPTVICPFTHSPSALLQARLNIIAAGNVTCDTRRRTAASFVKMPDNIHLHAARTAKAGHWLHKYTAAQCLHCDLATSSISSCSSQTHDTQQRAIE